MSLNLEKDKLKKRRKRDSEFYKKISLYAGGSLVFLGMVGMLVFGIGKFVSDFSNKQIVAAEELKETVLEEKEVVEEVQEVVVPTEKTIKTGEKIVTLQGRNVVPFSNEGLHLYFAGYESTSNNENAHIKIHVVGEKDNYDGKSIYTGEFTFVNLSVGDEIQLPMTDMVLWVNEIIVEKNSIKLEYKG